MILIHSSGRKSTGERFATRKRGTTVLVPLARNPRSRRQLEVVHGELASRQTDWSGAGYRDDRKQILRAGASGRPRGGPMIAGRGSRQPRLFEAAQPRIHEGMCWGAVGLRPFTSGKRTRHDLVTPDRLHRLEHACVPSPNPEIPRTTNPAAGTIAKPATRPARFTSALYRLTPRTLSGMYHYQNPL